MKFEKSLFKPSSRRADGFTLVELLVTLVILTSLLVPILGFFNSSFKQNVQSKEYTRMRFLAEEEMEKLISLAYDDAQLDAFATLSGRTSFFEAGDFVVKTNIVFLDGETGNLPDRYPLRKEEDSFLKKITVSVARKDKLGGQVDLVYFKSP